MRRILSIIALLLAGLLAITACSPGQTGPAVQTNSSWTTKYRGTTLHVLAESNQIMRTTQDLLDDFQRKTGIKVVLEEAPYDDLVQKATLDLATNSGGYDLVDVPSEYLGSFVENHYIEPIDHFAHTPQGTGDGYNPDDIVPTLWKDAAKWDGHYYGIPANSAVMMRMYRKDLFTNSANKKAYEARYHHRLQPPKTLSEYLRVAQFFTRKKGQRLSGSKLTHPMYGVATTGKRHTSSALEWLNYAWLFHGGIFDSHGMPDLNSKENVTALNYMKQLAAFSPPGTSSATWDEVNSELQQGIAAQAIQWSDLAGGLEKSSESDVNGKMAYTSLPVKSAGDTPVAHDGPWTWAVGKSSDNKSAAKLFMAWYGSRKIQTKILKDGGVPILTSVFKDKALNSQIPHLRQQLVSLKQGRPRPRIPQWGAISTVLERVVSEVVAGQKQPRASLAHAQSELKTLMHGSLPVRER